MDSIFFCFNDLILFQYILFIDIFRRHRWFLVFCGKGFVSLWNPFDQFSYFVRTKNRFTTVLLFYTGFGYMWVITTTGPSQYTIPTRKVHRRTFICDYLLSDRWWCLPSKSVVGSRIYTKPSNSVDLETVCVL